MKRKSFHRIVSQKVENYEDEYHAVTHFPFWKLRERKGVGSIFCCVIRKLMMRYFPFELLWPTFGSAFFNPQFIVFYEYDTHEPLPMRIKGLCKSRAHLQRKVVEGSRRRRQVLPRRRNPQNPQWTQLFHCLASLSLYGLEGTSVPNQNWKERKTRLARTLEGREG